MPDITDPASRREERLDAQTLRVTRKSTFSGRLNVMVLKITAAEWARYQGGELIQLALPGLTNPEREFLLTGSTQPEWDAAFPPEDEAA